MTLSIAQDQILSPKSTEMVKLMAGSHGHCPCDRGFFCVPSMFDSLGVKVPFTT